MRNIIMFLRTVITGFFTGILFAIPLGPAGMESIKKTLNYGIGQGLLVALGAVLADAVDIFLINVGLFNILSQNKRTEGIFFIVCGFLIMIFAISDYKRNKFNKDMKKFDSMPVLKGFLIAFTNPMTHSFWLTISGTMIHRLSDNGALQYYSFLIFIIIGMFTWFVFLNIVAMRGIKRFETTNRDEFVEKLIIIALFIFGIGFIIYGAFKMIAR